MPSLFRPSEAEIAAYLDEMRRVPLRPQSPAYSIENPPRGFTKSEKRVMIGTGSHTFERGCLAVRSWRMFPQDWTRIEPENASIRDGETIAVLASFIGFWWLFACRIVEVIEEHGTTERFGFVYRTLPGHLMEGEERFLIEWSQGDDSVWYTIDAVSKPVRLLGKVGAPSLKWVQRRFREDSSASMIEASQNFNPLTAERPLL